MISSFLIGESLLVAPALSDDFAYPCFIPKGTWVNINNMGDLIVSKGNYQTIRRSDTTNVYIREG